AQARVARATRYDYPAPRTPPTVPRVDQSSDPLAPLQDETLRGIAATGVVRSFPRHTILINEGDVGDALYIVLSGRVKVFASNEAGREFVIDFQGPGEYVGEMSLDGAPRSASVMTIEPTTCAVVNRAQLRDFILAHPEFAMHLIEKLIHRVRVTTSNLKSLALSDVYGRLARLVNALAREVDGRTLVPERLTQQEIADRVGASRDMVGKLMKDLVAGGYLGIEEHTIIVLRKLPPGW
ncbi:MAG: Crp/Fnr family transcriptional regulator, partial [Casimicrobiaceae bacterium]